MRHVNVTVKGKVQGVFYRASTRDKAIEIGLKGFVRNEPNGDVYMEIEGSDEEVAALLVWAKEGPPRAIVSEVVSTEGQLVGFSDFRIQR